MALLWELPIYRDTYNLVSLIVDYVNSFPKTHKYTIGQKLENETLDLFKYINLANKEKYNKEKKKEYLNEFIKTFDLIKILLRLCVEKKFLSLKQMVRITMITDNIGKQVYGWIKTVK